MKQSSVTALSIISVIAAISSLIAMLVLFLTSLNIYGNLQAIPLEDFFPVFAFALGFLFFLALMILFMILGPEEKEQPRYPLLLEEPELPSDAPVPFIQRLAYELKFCTEHKADMSLLLIQFSGTSDDFKRKLSRFFDASSFIVPYEENRIGVIIPFHDVRTASRELKDCFQQFKGEFSSTDRPCYGGLTSRSARLIDADTLLFEAEVSLQRAMDEQSSCVMCFHPDPIKYQKHH